MGHFKKKRPAWVPTGFDTGKPPKPIFYEIWNNFINKLKKFKIV